jgi:Ca2+-binding EF-hand superfamily protein
MNITLRSLLFPTILTAAFTVTACNGADPDLEIGESAAYIMSAEEGEDLAPEAMSELGDTAVDAATEEEVETPVGPEDAAEYGACDFPRLRQRVREQYDADGDGTLSEAERTAAREDLQGRAQNHPRLARMIRRLRNAPFDRLVWAFDEDEDGSLSPEERSALVDAMQARCALRRSRILARFDADGDGTLSQAELVAARAARRERLQERHQRVLDRYDANDDGILDRAERNALKADVRARWLQRKAEVIAEFDANGDGVLDATERAALREAIQRRIAEGRGAPEVEETPES